MTGSPPPRSRRSSALVRTALRLVGPLLLVLVIARMKDAGAVLDTFRSAAGWPLALAVALNLVSVHVKVVRWGVLLRTRGIAYPLRQAWTSFLASSYAGMLTPGRVGDALRAQYLRHDLGVPYAEGLASVAMDRICDLYVLAGFVAVAVVRFSSVVAGKLAFLTWLTVAATVLAPLLLFLPGVAESVVRVVYKKLAQGTEAGAETGTEAGTQVGAEAGAAAGAQVVAGAGVKAGAEPDRGSPARPGAEGESPRTAHVAGPAGPALFLLALRAQVGRSLFLTVPLTVAAFATNYAQGWLLARALHLEISFFDVTCLLAVASLLGLLPVSVSGLGVRELFFALVFPVLGYSPATGVGFGLLVFAVLYLAVVVLGFIGWQIAPPPVAAKPPAS
jgi:uncharacterized membrane protein YbhN (UPF0104 family)